MFEYIGEDMKLKFIAATLLFFVSNVQCYTASELFNLAVSGVKKGAGSAELKDVVDTIIVKNKLKFADVKAKYKYVFGTEDEPTSAGGGDPFAGSNAVKEAIKKGDAKEIAETKAAYITKTLYKDALQSTKDAGADKAFAELQKFEPSKVNLK